MLSRDSLTRRSLSYIFPMSPDDIKGCDSLVGLLLMIICPPALIYLLLLCAHRYRRWALNAEAGIDIVVRCACTCGCG
jgi:hypothetical protein